MKKIVIVIGAVLAVAVLGLGVYHSDASHKSQLLTEKEITELVSAQYPGEVTKMELNNGKYDVQIKGKNAEYLLTMDAESGEVLKLKESLTLTVKEAPEEAKKEEQPKKEPKKDTGQDAPKKDKTPATSISKNDQQKASEGKKKQEKKKTVISQDEAIKIALSQFSGEVDDVELDEEDGRLVYEIEIERGDREADIEIDAYTGEVIVMEIDD